MSTQVAIRLPEDAVAQMDEIVAAGEAASRTELVTIAVARELRRRAAERDVRILREKGADDDLDALVDWTAENIVIERT